MNLIEAATIATPVLILWQIIRGMKKDMPECVAKAERNRNKEGLVDLTLFFRSERGCSIQMIWVDEYDIEDCGTFQPKYRQEILVPPCHFPSHEIETGYKTIQQFKPTKVELMLKPKGRERTEEHMLTVHYSLRSHPLLSRLAFLLSSSTRCLLSSRS